MLSEEMSELFLEAQELFLSDTASAKVEAIQMLDRALSSNTLSSEDAAFFQKASQTWQRVMHSEYLQYADTKDQYAKLLRKSCFLYSIKGDHKAALRLDARFLMSFGPGTVGLQYALSHMVESAIDADCKDLAVTAAQMAYHHLAYLSLLQTQPLQNIAVEDTLFVPLELGLPVETAISQVGVQADPIWVLILERFVAENLAYFMGDEKWRMMDRTRLHDFYYGTIGFRMAARTALHEFYREIGDVEKIAWLQSLGE